MVSPRIAVYIFFVGLFYPAYADRILSFISVSTIHKDSSITVEETLKVKVTDLGKHGIVREFPTTYHDRHNNRYRVGFTLEKALKDGEKVPFTIKNAVNGKAIYIGDPHTTLKPGIYTYILTYTTNRQLGFFKEWDEFYWNVTGNGWRLPIDAVTAEVILPGNVTQHDLHAEAYTGAQGAKGHDYTTSITPQGHVIFKTTRGLAPFEGLTIVVTWPKGIVTKPSQLQEWYYFARDNFGAVWLLLGALLTFLFYIRTYLRARRFKTGGTIIPLFEPPSGLSPSQVHSLYYRTIDTKAFASEIVDMAVHGLLEIKYNKGLLYGGTYTLQAKDTDTQNEMHKALLSTLFHSGPTLPITQKNERTVAKALRFLQNRLSSFDQKYLNNNSDAYLTALLISGGFLFSSLLFSGNALWFFIALAAFILMHAVFYTLIQTYTPEGFKLYNAIAGFRMFLKTTEEERLKIIGTPPTKTPELFEKYLPYAIALGVEEAWSKKFAPIFAQYKAEGHPYAPIWYVGGPVGSFNPHALSTSFTNSVNSIVSTSRVSSSSYIPGSTSGRGGGGSSGGGGGGGGGGTW